MSVDPTQNNINNTAASTPAANTSKVNTKFTCYASMININWHSNPVAHVITEIGNLVAKAFVTLFVDLPRFAAYQLGLNDGTTSYFTNREVTNLTATLQNLEDLPPNAFFDVDSDVEENPLSSTEAPAALKDILSCFDEDGQTPPEMIKQQENHAAEKRFADNLTDDLFAKVFGNTASKDTAVPAKPSSSTVDQTIPLAKESAEEIEDTAVPAAPNRSPYRQVAQTVLSVTPVMLAIFLAYRSADTCPPPYPCPEPTGSALGRLQNLTDGLVSTLSNQFSAIAGSANEFVSTLSNQFSATGNFTWDGETRPFHPGTMPYGN